jgi:hypothetical protein
LKNHVVNVEKDVVGIVQRFYLFAFDCEREMYIRPIPDEKDSLVQLKRCPTIFLL